MNIYLLLLLMWWFDYCHSFLSRFMCVFHSNFFYWIKRNRLVEKKMYILFSVCFLKNSFETTNMNDGVGSFLSCPKGCSKLKRFFLWMLINSWLIFVCLFDPIRYLFFSFIHLHTYQTSFFFVDLILFFYHHHIYILGTINVISIIFFSTNRFSSYQANPFFLFNHPKKGKKTHDLCT